MAGIIYDTIELTGSEFCPSRWDRTTVADGNWLQSNTLDPLRYTDLFLASAIDDVIDDIDTMKAATDVIAVYGTFSAFSNNSGDLVSTSALTDKDVIKVLNDESKDKKQVYYQWDASGSEWSDIGFLEPYYSTTQIDAMSAEIYDRIDEVEANSISAVEHDSNLTGDGTETNPLGLNSAIVLSGAGATANYTYTGISLTASDSTTASAAVEDIIRWNTVTGKLNGTAITGENGISAEYDSANNRWKVGASADLLGSAHSGAAASAWISSNTGNYVRHNETALKIGNTSYLTATDNATAFGYNNNARLNYSFAAGQNLSADNNSVAFGTYASARGNSFAVGFGGVDTGITATRKAFAVGENISADFNAYIIGNNNFGASGTFIYGTNNSGNTNTIIGNFNKNTNGGMIFGNYNSADLTTAPSMVLLGNVCRGNYTTGDLLAVGWGDSAEPRDAMLVTQTAVKLWPKFGLQGRTNGVDITTSGIYDYTTKKIYPFVEISGVTLTPSWPAAANSLNKLAYNNLMFNSNNGVNGNFGGYITDSTPGTTYHSNTFKIFSNVNSGTYRIGIPVGWTVILKGFDPKNGVEASAYNTGVRNLHWITGTGSGHSWYPEIPPFNNRGTYISASDFIKPSANGTDEYWCLWIDTLFGEQYIDCIVDRASRTFAMFKGGFGGAN